MSRWHNYCEDGMVHFCTATVQGWQPKLDARAAAVLYREWERASAGLCVKVLAYVIMPNHIHLLLWSERGESICRFLQATLSRASKRIGAGGQFWKERARVVALHSEEAIRIKLDYIHANPIKRGLVTVAEDWPMSSFRRWELSMPGAFVCDPWPEMIALPIR